ncbi:unnamed protein product [Trichobilharzia szidati]|nr:unnamed protein product [Trichobilharzia szidati]
MHKGQNVQTTTTVSKQAGGMKTTPVQQSLAVPRNVSANFKALATNMKTGGASMTVRTTVTKTVSNTVTYRQHSGATTAKQASIGMAKSTGGKSGSGGKR